jgi:hypothetical protein
LRSRLPRQTILFVAVLMRVSAMNLGQPFGPDHLPAP